MKLFYRICISHIPSNFNLRTTDPILSDVHVRVTKYISKSIRNNIKDHFKFCSIEYNGEKRSCNRKNNLKKKSVIDFLSKL